MSFEDFLEQFKKRHKNEFGLDSGRFVAMPKVDVKVLEIKPQVANGAGLDRMSQAAGEDWDAIEYTEEPEVIE